MGAGSAKYALIAAALLLFMLWFDSCDRTEVYSLETTAEPPTGGAVTVTPSGTEFEEGTRVELTANPSGNYLFERWEGDLTGTQNPYSFEIDGDKDVVARFELIEYALHIEVQGEGTVEQQVMSSDNYDHGSRVQLTPRPARGWRFDHWEDDLQGDAVPATITMTGERSVTVVFERKEYPLTVEVQGKGDVEEQVAQARTTDYDFETIVTLTAKPHEGWAFMRWEGDLQGGENPVDIKVDTAKSVTAAFEIKSYTLQMETEGEGNVARDPDREQYEHFEEVTLTAEPDKGWRFDRWEGDLSGSDNPETITIDKSYSITAVFDLHEYELTTRVKGEGTVLRDPDRLNFHHFDEVTLTAEPAEGWTFHRWEGALEGSDNPQTLTITGEHTVTAVMDFIETKPVVQTTHVSEISGFSAEGGGEIDSDGGLNISGSGICWSSSPGPTLADECTDEGVSSGSFSSTLSTLEPTTTYYLRAYATNSLGTSYGGELSFTTEDPATPHSFLLSWQRDPTSTMTVDWHMDPGEEEWVQYRRSGQNAWKGIYGKEIEWPNTSRQIRRAELTGLSPNTTYEFRFTDKNTYTFRTLPSTDSRTIRFAAAGDVMHTAQWMRQTAQVASQYNLDFVVFGGDLAYANGGVNQVSRWYEYLEVWSEEMITDGNRVIPHLAALGNHEVQGQFVFNQDYSQTDAHRASVAPYFYSLMAFPGQPGYGVLDFGDYMSLIFLDSNHTNPPGGQQADWLENALNARQDGRHLFPVYHVGAYPSRRKDEITNQEVRQHWVPLFEQYGVNVAFENHNHNYKRTVPLKGGSQSSDGIVYMGDGSWGVALEPPEPYSYLLKAGAIRHFILVEVDGSQVSMRAIDVNGSEFDQVTVTN